MVEEGETLSARGKVGPPVDAIAYLLDHVRQLDALVLAQQALINQILRELEDARGDDLSAEFDPVVERLSVALRELIATKDRWRAISIASIDRGDRQPTGPDR